MDEIEAKHREREFSDINNYQSSPAIKAASENIFNDSEGRRSS